MTRKHSAGKGDSYRPVDRDKWDKNWELVFGGTMDTDLRTSKVLDKVHVERRRQDEKWGVQNHDNDHWGTILAEEVGEVAKACLEEGDKAVRDELVQVAAVAVAWIECIERNRPDAD